uniref:COesterase domain-containing protein n=1 Tax=Caenorhabditis tropicalis TaxID=1561998 RepID=A0A1I7U4P9_9PELO
MGGSPRDQGVQASVYEDTYQLPENNPVSEDCLYLNIYTNSFCLQNKNCSVLVVVHGGQMIRGNAAMFHSDVITNNFVGQGRNVIVVTVPYRLGIFGLPNFPGDLEGALDRNLILYDVIEALKWVQLEIMNFGGDPKRTTYFGHSGGGSIGAVLGLLPESEHLYQKMILMSAPRDIEIGSVIDANKPKEGGIGYVVIPNEQCQVVLSSFVVLPRDD